MENIVVKILIASLILTMGYFGSKVIGKVMATRWTSVSAQTMSEYEEDYSQKVAQENDVAKLTEQGLHMIRTKQYNLALINLRRATQVDRNYRDAWVWLGYARLKNDEPDTALSALKNAEEIDPINPQTYQFLAMVYDRLGKKDEAQRAREKFNYLTNKNSD